MAAYFRFYGDLNDFLPSARQQITFAYPAYDGTQSVKHLIEAQGIPHTEVALILANGTAVTFDYLVQLGDCLAVYPPFATFTGAPLGLLRPTLPQPPRFLLDNHLGRLARYLRLLGFDTLYFNNQYDDVVLAQMAYDQQRVLLTRDRGLLKRSQVVYGYCLRTTDSLEQVTAVLHRYRLFVLIRPWCRCLRCNGLLHPVTKESVLHLLEPKTKLYYDDFRQCAECEQVYWQGSHYQRLQNFVYKIARYRIKK